MSTPPPSPAGSLPPEEAREDGDRLKTPALQHVGLCPHRASWRQGTGGECSKGQHLTGHGRWSGLAGSAWPPTQQTGAWVRSMHPGRWVSSTERQASAPTTDLLCCESQPRPQTPLREMKRVGSGIPRHCPRWGPLPLCCRGN